jgi:hypothetical protein
MQRTGELIVMGAIALMIAVGGRQLLVTLGHTKTWGALLGALLIVVALRQLRAAYDPASPDVRRDVTRASAYLCAAILALWAILWPARWVFGSCIAAAEIAIVFDIITLAAQRRTAGGV